MNVTSPASEASTFNDIGLAALEKRLQDDLACLCYPSRNWVPAAGTADTAQTDVVIIGAGMCGLLVWLALKTAGIQNIRILDSSPAGSEGPWLTYARMETLRSPKTLTGPAFGLGALTFQAWYRAQFGEEKWVELDKIPRPMWMDYLRWYRQALSVPVENNTTLTRVVPTGNHLHLTVSGDNAAEFVTRKLIYATGRDGIAKATIPCFVDSLQTTRWAHTSDDIDFSALKNQRVAVIGVGASAIDNAAEALEAGAAEVRHLIRRTEMPTINKMMGIGSYGFTTGYAALPDEWRWRYMQYSFSTQTPSPRGSTLRVSKYTNAFFHFGKSIRAITESADGLQIEFSDDTSLATDFVILGTGFTTDPEARGELGAATSEILLWRDVYTPPDDEKHDDLGRFPYLSPNFTFRPKHPGAAEWLNNIYCFNYGATASLGKVSGDIPGITEGARWLVRALSAQLYTEDIELHWQHLQQYSTPELLGDEWSPSQLPGENGRSDSS